MSNNKFSLNFKERYLQDPLGDLSGGLMAAIVALPLCLAFGVASGLGAAAGLYGAIACGILAALFGGTPAQCSGPTGPMTVVAASMFAANQNNPELVFAAAMLAGVIQIAMGYLRTGQLVHYFPYPVISGFMTGIGSIIVFIQIAPLLGESGSGNVLDALQDLPDTLMHINKDALLIGGATIAIIYLLPRLTRKIPSPLAALLFTTWYSVFSGMEVPRIGEIPSSLPMPKLPELQLHSMHVVVQNALTLAVLGAIDSLLTSLVMDKVSGKPHDSDQELVGQGIGNMVAGLIGGLPGAGATMRSMVNFKAGGRSFLSGAIHGVFLLAVLLGLGQLAAKIPLAALAGILMTVGLSIMDWRVIRGLHALPRSDIAVMAVVLFLTIFVDLIVAVLAGLALASMLFVKQLSDAETSHMSQLDSLEELKLLAEHIPEDIRSAIYTYQFNGPLFFGEAKNLSSMVDKLGVARYIILRFYNVPLVDQTGAYALEHAIEKWESRGIKVLFVGMQSHVRQILEATGAIHKMDLENCFDQYESALAAIDRFESKLNQAGSGKEITNEP